MNEDMNDTEDSISGYSDNFGHKHHSSLLDSALKCPQVVAAEALFKKNATEDVQTMLCLPPREAIDPSVERLID